MIEQREGNKWKVSKGKQTNNWLTKFWSWDGNNRRQKSESMNLTQVTNKMLLTKRTNNCSEAAAPGRDALLCHRSILAPHRGAVIDAPVILDGTGCIWRRQSRESLRLASSIQNRRAGGETCRGRSEVPRGW